jgi:hypothetical protein
VQLKKAEGGHEDNAGHDNAWQMVENWAQEQYTQADYSCRNYGEYFGFGSQTVRHTRAWKRPKCGISSEKRRKEIRHSKGNEFSIGRDLIVILGRIKLRDDDVLDEADYRNEDS